MNKRRNRRKTCWGLGERGVGVKKRFYGSTNIGSCHQQRGRGSWEGRVRGVRRRDYDGRKKAIWGQRRHEPKATFEAI